MAMAGITTRANARGSSSTSVEFRPGFRLGLGLGLCVVLGLW
jgi:hypothetical protein